MDEQELLQKIEQAAKDKVTELDLSGNQLSSLPPELATLSHLQQLYLSDNELSSLPPELAQLSNLQQLYLSNNQLSSLPPELAQLSNLQQLYLSNNQLSSLPPELAQLDNLRELYLHDNPLSIPPEILGPTWGEVNDGKQPANSQTIIRYYFDLINQQMLPLKEAKMLLLGQGNVGKTSLVNQILNGKYNPQENKTDGINIQQWNVEQVETTFPIKVNIWDFGGQEIMHATHQFFLTHRSLYLVVLDSRLSEEGNRLEYWLKLIDSFGGNSPMLVVGNKVDQHPLDLNKTGLQRKYPRIKGFVETSCAHGEGIEELKERIAEEINNLEHVGCLLPKAWFQVKAKLEALKQDYISYDQYVVLCQEEKVEEEESQHTLVGFLHDLGIVVNFQDNPRLEDTSVLKPEWVTNGVYKILNDRDLIIEHKGILKLSQLQRILDPKRYPRHKHAFLLELIEKFELCFPLFDLPNHYLIPDLLPKEEIYTGEWQNALTFEYHYKVLPSSIFSRFMVRMHEHIYHKTYWRRGIVLAYQNCKALVKCDREDKNIIISVIGSKNPRRSFLSQIRSQFEAIHKSFKGLEVEPQIRLPHRPELLIDYQDLVHLEEKGHSKWYLPKYGAEINISELLDEFGADRSRLKKPSPPKSPTKTSQRQSLPTTQEQEAARVALNNVLKAIGVYSGN